MLSKREMQSPEKLLELIDRAFESALFLNGYLGGTGEYIGRLQFWQGEALRHIIQNASDLLHDLAHVRSRMKQSTTLFPDSKGFEIAFGKAVRSAKKAEKGKQFTARKRKPPADHVWRTSTHKIVQDAIKRREAKQNP